MSWLRRNRWWLLVLPVCVGLMLGTSAYRVKGLWWSTGLHRVGASAAAGTSATYTEHYSDAYGETSRTFTVRLVDVHAQKRLAGFDGTNTGDLPSAGTQALATELAWSADPDQSLTLCHVDLVDDEGRRYEVPSGLTGQTDLCVPEDHEGPDQPITKEHPRGYVAPGMERPPSWTTTVVFQVPQGIHVATVLVYWTGPYFVELAAP